MADEDGRARARMIARRIEVGRAAMGAGDYELAELIFREAARRFESTKLARLADEAHAMAATQPRQSRDPEASPLPSPATGSVTRKPDSIVAQVEPSPKPATWAPPATGGVTPGGSSGWPTDSSGDPRTPPPPLPKPKTASVSKAWLFGGLAVVVVLIAIALSGLRGSTTSLPQTVAKVDLPPGTTLPATSTTTPAPTTTTPAPIAAPPPTTTTPATTSTVPASVQKPPTPSVVPPPTTTVPRPVVVPPPPTTTVPRPAVVPPPPTTTVPKPAVVPPPSERPPDKEPPGRGREEQRAAANQELVAALQSENALDFPAALLHLERARQLDPTVADFAQSVSRVKTKMKADATEAIVRARQFDALERVNQAIADYERAYRNLLDDDPARKMVKERLDALRARPR